VHILCTFYERRNNIAENNMHKKHQQISNKRIDSLERVINKMSIEEIKKINY
jgi:hypothetical protein